MPILTASELAAMPGLDTSNYTSAQLTAAIAQAQSIIEGYCERTFDSTTHNDWFDSQGGQYLRLREWPIIAVYRLSTMRGNVLSLTLGTATTMLVTVQSNLLTIDTDAGAGSVALVGSDSMATLATAIDAAMYGAVTATAIEESEAWSLRPGVWGASSMLGSTVYLEGPLYDNTAYTTQPEAGMIYAPGGWPTGPGSVYCHYVAGYQTGGYPKDLQLVCAQMALQSVKLSTSNITQEKVYNVTYTYGSSGGVTSLMTGHETVLNRYRRLM